jgi:hypothetical protein
MLQAPMVIKAHVYDVVVYNDGQRVAPGASGKQSSFEEARNEAPRLIIGLVRCESLRGAL